MHKKWGRKRIDLWLAWVAFGTLVGCATEVQKPVVIPAEQLSTVPIRTSQIYNGQPVTLHPFKLAGGEIRHLPVTDSGPVPAENDTIKIQVSGLIASRPEGAQQVPRLTWVFGFTAKQGLEIERVQVEQVFPSDTPLQMNPVIGILHCQLPAVGVDGG